MVTGVQQGWDAVRAAPPPLGHQRDSSLGIQAGRNPEALPATSPIRLPRASAVDEFCAEILQDAFHQHCLSVLYLHDQCRDSNSDLTVLIPENPCRDTGVKGKKMHFSPNPYFLSTTCCGTSQLCIAGCHIGEMCEGASHKDSATVQ